MHSWIVEYWPWSFILAWLIGAWGLSLPLYGGVLRRRHREKFTLPAVRRQSFYVCIDYRLSARAGNSLAGAVDHVPDGRSIYLRTEFFLKYVSEFHPEDTLREWFRAGKWARARRLWAQRLAQEQKTALEAIRRCRVSEIYHPRPNPKDKPLALTFPLLPGQFTLFVAREFPMLHRGETGLTAPGFYFCRVTDWRDDDSYAEDIELQNMNGECLYTDQKSLLDALRLRKAAVESVRFLDLPIFVFSGPHRKITRRSTGQKIGGKIPVRPATPREFMTLDARLLKLFGGINPLNLVRLSWFYHPENGIKPDRAKYRRLLARADGKNDITVSR